MMHIGTSAASVQPHAWLPRTETSEQTHARLRHVIQHAWLKVYGGRWVFEEFPAVEFNTRVSPEAIALVRDDQVWSQLVPHFGQGEAYRVLSFHFPPGVDHSGFVGWLASMIQQNFGAGVFVTSGSNGEAGIFDYWGVPDEIGDEVIEFVARLAGGRPS
jgi:hypothetical protein